MKSFPYLLFLLLALSALTLWVWKILHEGSEPLSPLVQDMVHQPMRQPSLPPPPGAVPFNSGASALPPPSGEALFLQHCAVCHGVGGTGQSYVAQQTGMPEISDLSATASTPAELARTLTEGRGSMPAFGTRLSEEKRQLLLQYIQTLHQP